LFWTVALDKQDRLVADLRGRLAESHQAAPRFVPVKAILAESAPSAPAKTQPPCTILAGHYICLIRGCQIANLRFRTRVATPS